MEDLDDEGEGSEESENEEEEAQGESAPEGYEGMPGVKIRVEDDARFIRKLPTLYFPPRRWWIITTCRGTFLFGIGAIYAFRRGEKKWIIAA